MLTSGLTIRKLRTAKVLTDNGLDLSPLKEIATFAGPHIEMTTAFAIIWEVARRYNVTYRVSNPPTHRWVMEDQDSWNQEALCFAQGVMRDWSGLPQVWFPDLDVRKPSGSPDRQGLTDTTQRGMLSWMREVYKIVRYHILAGRELCDSDDVDRKSIMRQHFLRNGQSVPPRYLYKPLQMPQFEIEVGPTSLDPVIAFEGASSPEDEVVALQEDAHDANHVWDLVRVRGEKAIKRRFDLFLKEPLDQKYPSGDTTLVGSPASVRIKSGSTTAVASPSKPSAKSRVR